MVGAIRQGFIKGIWIFMLPSGPRKGPRVRKKVREKLRKKVHEKLREKVRGSVKRSAKRSAGSVGSTGRSKGFDWSTRSTGKSARFAISVAKVIVKVRVKFGQG